MPTPKTPTPKTLTCGCCSNGCVCWNHQDTPAGRPPTRCEHHTKATE